MEGVAAAASVAGILTLVGQSINSLVKLKVFYARLSTASRTVDGFLQDINALLRALHGVQDLLGKWPGQRTDVHTASLLVQVEECSKDVCDWLQTARDMRPATNKGGKAWFKKFWIAVNRNKVKDIRLDIDRHRHALDTSLAILGRSIDVDSSQRMQSLNKKLEDLAFRSISSHNLQQQMNNGLEAFRNASSLNSAESSRSLASIASSLSKTEALIPPTPVNPPSEAVKDGTVNHAATCSGTVSCINRTPSSNHSYPEPRLSESVNEDAVEHSISGEHASSHRIEKSEASYDYPAVLSISDDESLSSRVDSISISARHPKLVDSGHEISQQFGAKEEPRFCDYEDSRRWLCHICYDRVNSMFELDQHIEIVHHLTISWTCARLDGDFMRAYALVPDNAHAFGFHYIGLTQSQPLMCGFCGIKVFNDTRNKLRLLSHLKREHSFCLCDLSESIYHSDDFLRHLEQRHQASPGSWIMILQAACRASNLFTPIKALADLIKHGVRSTEALIGTVEEVSSESFKTIELRQTLTHLNLLGQWSGTRDRINRWLFDSLLADKAQARLLRSQMPALDLEESTWLRLILQYWFIDEAATGVEIAYSLSEGAVDSKTSSSLESSESSEYWTCAEEEEITSPMIRNHTD